MSLKLSAEEQLERLADGSVELVRREELLDKLRRGRPLVVKLGFDPSAPDIHFGHLVQLRKLRQFQDLGHQVVFVVGDFTARIGDPSGRSKTRPALTAPQIDANAETYKKQVTMVLDAESMRLEHNSSWLDPLGSTGWIKLAARMTVARMLERDDFQKRYQANKPISLHEFLYPLAQGYDSVALKADLELGGTDQTFNLLIGRDLMRDEGLEPQVIMTMPLLVGLDGQEKMSKSLGNYIALTDTAEDIFGKTMSVSDELMWSYWQLLTDVGADELGRLRSRIEAGELHPMNVKQDLAGRLVALVHGEEAAARAAQGFTRVVRHKERPESVEVKSLPAQADPLPVAKLVALAGLAASVSEARRLIQGGGVRLDGDAVGDARAAVAASAGTRYELRVGKRHYLQVRFDDAG